MKADQANYKSKKSLIEMFKERIETACEYGRFETTIHEDHGLYKYINDNRNHITEELGYKVVHSSEIHEMPYPKAYYTISWYDSDLN